MTGICILQNIQTYIIMKDHPKWNFKEFTAFLLIYAASADFVITPEEEQMVKDHVGEESYHEIMEEFQSYSDYDKAQVILDYKGLYFPTTERKNEIIDMVKKQFLSDGVFSQVEKSLLVVLERIM